MKADALSVTFDTHPTLVRGKNILRLPEDISKRMPSRGQVAVIGRIGNQDLRTVLEPDGYWGHYIRLDDILHKAPEEALPVQLTVTKEWPEPKLPKDVTAALEESPQKVKDKWQDITPMARWEWIRWINATANNDTRTIRIEKTISKLNGKHRRPCCFNLAACTDIELARSGRLDIPV